MHTYIKQTPILTYISLVCSKPAFHKTEMNILYKMKNIKLQYCILLYLPVPYVGSFLTRRFKRFSKCFLDL